MSEESRLVEAFILPAKRGRYKQLLANPARRGSVTAALAHCRDLDPRWLLPAPTDAEPASIDELLRAHGAPETCYVLSESPDLDGRRLPLLSALEQVVGQGWGTLLSCIPGVLAYYEGEGPSDRYLLARTGEARRR